MFNNSLSDPIHSLYIDRVHRQNSAIVKGRKQENSRITLKGKSQKIRSEIRLAVVRAGVGFQVWENKASIENTENVGSDRMLSYTVFIDSAFLNMCADPNSATFCST